MEAFLIVAAVMLVVLFIACGFIYNQLVWCKTIPVPGFIAKLIAGNSNPDAFEVDHKKAEKVFQALPLEGITLTAPDKARLKGNIAVPENGNGRLFIAFHGARSSGEGEFCFMAPELFKKGYTILMPEHRGCGVSDGRFMGYGTHESEDGLLWLSYAKERFPSLDVFILGVSMGGATVLMMSDKIDGFDVKGIVADCPYTSAWDEFAYQLKASFHLPAFPLLNICNLYSRIFGRYSFKDASALEHVKNTKTPVLFIHGKEDDFVPFFMQKILFDACPSEKYLLAVDGAVHARSYYTAPEAYTGAIESFFDKTETK